MDTDKHLPMVLRLYDLPDDTNVSLLHGGTANRNYVITTAGSRFVLRVRNQKYSEKDALDYEVQYLSFLYDHGLPVPVPLRTRGGDSWAQVGGRIYQLFPFLAGQPFDPDADSEIAEAGRFLAKLHKTLEKFVLIKEKKLPRMDDPAVIKPVLDFHIAKNAISDTENMVMLHDIRATVTEISRHVPDDVYDRLPSVVIHGDYHPANVVYREGKISGLFDFDWISRQPRVRDIVDGIIYFTGERSAQIDGGDIFSLTQPLNFRLRQMRIFTDAYLQNTDLPLQEGEMNSVPYLIAARMIHSRVQALPKIPRHRSLEMLTAGLKEPLQWLEQHKREVMSVLSE